MGQDFTEPAYDAFASPERVGIIRQNKLMQWNAVIGLRNRIVHNYVNVDIQFIYNLISNNQYKFLGEFWIWKIQTS